MRGAAYLRLMRFHKPVGIFLLWFPIAWALWVANQGVPPVRLLLVFFLGTVIMRAAGCVINDIADRDIDRHVRRTADRPLTSGEVTMKGALWVLFSLLTAAAILLFFLPWSTLYYAVIAVAVTIIYPFCKRFITAPQAVLGLAFSLGMPMAFLASDVHFNSQLAKLMLINFLWVISYDTMYAMADRADDLKIGIKSTAILFGDYDRLVLGILQLTIHLLWLLWALSCQLSIVFYLVWGMGGFILYYQQTLVHHRVASDCFKGFYINVYYGACMWLALILAY